MPRSVPASLAVKPVSYTHLDVYKRQAPDLGTVVIKEALKRTGIKPEQVDEVYMGLSLIHIL